MIIQSQQAEREAILNVAKQMAVAARTAPKTRGMDFLETLIVTGDDLFKIADCMEKIGQRPNMAFCSRDADNVRKSEAVLLLGTGHHTRGLNEECQYCGSINCKACVDSGNSCVYDPIDLGIAASSAASVAADNRVDNRIMFSVGIAVKELKLFNEEITVIFGIPLSASGKSIYYDR